MQTINPQEILSLSIPERIQLVEDLWDSIAADQNAVEITEMQKHELDKRLADYALNPDDGDTWNEVRKRLWHAL
ncbi:addiction module protein [Geobacter argillaceus]|uniref:Putative addiction module component (TIGR02574 family) n=1 Tax=Geobacter argillaceus TaxID=345631 RepID=A0A562WSD1_9BACT|nr:addiction module protein [Geobacter argillaceus]TWJ33035.1 putative addiction module component (TIGR02574 family) [Geobacter argillaceus]